MDDDPIVIPDMSGEKMLNSAVFRLRKRTGHDLSSVFRLRKRVSNHNLKPHHNDDDPLGLLGSTFRLRKRIPITMPRNMEPEDYYYF
jgi:hypothetical protein